MSFTIIGDDTLCSGCLTCMLRCSFKSEKTYNLSLSRIMIKRLVNRPTEFTISFSDKCDGCGICAKYCPYEALKAEKVTRKGVQA